MVLTNQNSLNKATAGDQHLQAQFTAHPPACYYTCTSSHPSGDRKSKPAKGGRTQEELSKERCSSIPKPGQCSLEWWMTGVSLVPPLSITDGGKFEIGVTCSFRGWQFGTCTLVQAFSSFQ